MVLLYLYLTLSYPFFFFYFYGDHRDLHSFPTRRSSDLLEVKNGNYAQAIERLREAVNLDSQAMNYHLLLARESRLDRKSTRLNSSHVAISYAVFCLKKKIQNNMFVSTLEKSFNHKAYID